MGLAILSGMNAQELMQHIHNQDIAQLTKIPGIGKRTAERLLVEMRDKFSENSSHHFNLNAKSTDPQQEAISALYSPEGYRAQDAARCINQLATPAHSSQDLIRLALQQL